MPPSFDIETVQTNGTLRLVLVGELDIATAPLLEAAVEQAEETDGLAILLDLTRVPFIDSSGLRALLRASSRSSNDGGRLRISNPSPQARRLFELSGAAERLPLVD
ncbi:MAG: STAS domain-containing protein [Solirubrobacteraceae bacterium]